MQKKGWLVYSQNTTLGPMTPAKLREMLRSGDIDPFDLVSLEGSTVRIPLIEADQIFEPEHDNPIDTNSSSPTQAAFEELISKNNHQNVFGNNFASNTNGQNTVVSNQAAGEVFRPRRFEALAVNAPQPNKTQQNVLPQRRPKKYFLIDKNQRNFGPLDPSEILNMWLRGNLTEQTRVERSDTQTSVPIKKFVEAYLRAKNPGQTGGYERAKNSSATPAMKPQLVEIAPPKKSNANFLLYGVSFVSIMSAIALAIYAFVARHDHESLLEPIPPQALQPVVIEEAPVVHAPRVVQEAPVVVQPNEATPSAAPKTAPAKTPVKVVKEFKPLKPLKPEPTPFVAPVKPAAPKQVVAKKAQKKTPPVTQKKPVTPPRLAKADVPKPAPAVTKPVAAKPVASAAAPKPAAAPAAKPAAPQPPANANPPGNLVNGTTVTIGPYTYNPMAVDSCATMKCRLPMDGPKGPIVAVFFKGAYANTLKRKNGSAMLTGHPDNSSGVTLFYIESVK